MLSWHSEWNKAAVTGGRIHHHCGILSSAAFYRKSGRCRWDLVNTLAHQRIFTICVGASGETPGSLSPLRFQSRPSLPAVFKSWPAPTVFATAVRFFCYTVTHTHPVLHRCSFRAAAEFLIYLIYHSGTLLVPPIPTRWFRNHCYSSFCYPEGAPGSAAPYKFPKEAPSLSLSAGCVYHYRV